MVGLTAAVLLSAAVAAGTDETSRLPFLSTDQLVVQTDGSGGTRTLSGVIEDLSGETIVFRRSSQSVEVYNLREVTSLRFQKSAEFDEGLRNLRQRDWRGAELALRSAAAVETRKWVLREIRGALSQALRAERRFEECLQTVEKILKEDASSRHAAELPLVWDERTAPEDRISLAADSLQSDSEATRLTAASVLLQDPQFQASALAVLQSLRKTARGRISELAECQQWRIRLLRPAELRESEVTHWRQRVRQLDRRIRSGAEFVIGRALLALHDYDSAATSLLWMPLLEPLDPPVTAGSLSDALTALKLSGRTAEAETLRAEFALLLDDSQRVSGPGRSR